MMAACMGSMPSYSAVLMVVDMRDAKKSCRLVVEASMLMAGGAGVKSRACSADYIHQAYFPSWILYRTSGTWSDHGCGAKRQSTSLGRTAQGCGTITLEVGLCWVLLQLPHFLWLSSQETRNHTGTT